MRSLGGTYVEPAGGGDDDVGHGADWLQEHVQTEDRKSTL